MSIWSSSVDHNNMKKAEWELKDSSKSKVKQSFTNNGNGTFSASYDLSNLPSNATSWAWNGKLEDRNRNKYEENPNITILAGGTGGTGGGSGGSGGTGGTGGTGGSGGSGGGGGAMHVDNIDVIDVGTNGPWHEGHATITILDGGGGPVSGATVDASFTGSTSGSTSGVTNGSGTVTLESSKNKNSWSGEFCVDDVTLGGSTYDSGANVETCDTTP